MHKIFQSYYDDLSKHYLDKAAEPIDVSFNLGHPLFEYNIFKTLLANGTMNPDAGPVGLISWKFKAKTLIDVGEFSVLCEKAFAHGVDVAFINPMIGSEAIYKNVWEQGEHCGHVGMQAIANALFSEQELKRIEFMPQSKFAFCNYFVGNSAFWEQYIAFCDKIIAKIEKFKETNPTIFSLIYQSADYQRNKSLTFMPFIIERLFSTFLMLHPHIKTANSQCVPVLYEKKFDGTLGNYLYALSGLRNKAIQSMQPEMLKKWDELRQPALDAKLAEDIWVKDGPEPHWTVTRNGTTVTIKEIEPAFSQMLERGDFEDLFENIFTIAHNLMTPSTLIGQALFAPQLDSLLQKASAVLVKETLQPKPIDLIVHVASEIGEVGGHTRAIEDIMRAAPDYRHVLILTDPKSFYSKGTLTLDLLKERFLQLNFEIILLKKTTQYQKALELSEHIQKLSPETIFIHPHQYDVAANTISVKSASRVFFHHHCDHTPSLGATRNDFVHIDVTPLAYEACQQACSTQPIYLGLCAEDKGIIDLRMAPLIGATCGTYNKYQGRREFNYAELLAALFASNVTKMFHIGDVPEEQKQKIKDEIDALGQNAERLIFLPNTPSLAVLLKELTPSFFLCSYPLGGGKTMIEMMSLGLPILNPRADSTPPLLCADMSLGGALTIKTIQDVPQVLERLQHEGKHLGQHNRKIFEQHYSASAFRKKLMQIITN